MKNHKPSSFAQAGQAIQHVLQAERDAEQAIQDCENEARQIIHNAQNSAQRINACTDQRITNMEMRHSHKIDQTVKDIARQGAVELRLDAGQQHDADRLKAVIERLAVELCQSNHAAQD